MGPPFVSTDQQHRPLCPVECDGAHAFRAVVWCDMSEVVVQSTIDAAASLCAPEYADHWFPSKWFPLSTDVLYLSTLYVCKLQAAVICG